MMNNLFSIGEVSKIKEITVKALRYYHRMGILLPRYIDEATGYRYYSIDQFIYIDIIKGCRALGTSIAELQEIFKECDTDKLVEFLKLKRLEAEENIKKIQEIIKNIDDLNSSVEYAKDIVGKEDIVIKDFEERFIIVAPCKEAGDLRELLYYSELERVAKDKGVEMSMERGIIYDFDNSGKVEPLYVFNGVLEKENIKEDNSIKTLPKGRYLTITYSKENEAQRVKKIINYVKENKLKVKTFVEVELYNDLFNTRSYSCQIQILIEI